MHLGVLPVLRSGGGGTYQYSLTVLDVLGRWVNGGKQHDLTVFSPPHHAAALELLPAQPWSVRAIEPLTLFDRVRRRLGVPKKSSPTSWRRWLQQSGVELMVYTLSTQRSFEGGVPYLMAIHDLQHRNYPEFPEVAGNGEYERREYYYRNGCQHATLVMVDSEVGKEDVLNAYGDCITADRIKVLPYLPACYLPTEVPAATKQRVRQKYELPERYLFYPAQFWPHKNHVRIIEALGQLKRRGVTPVIVFCGSIDEENREQRYQDVMQRAQELDVAGQLRCPGFAPEEDMAALYAEATALVMPTFFGPTNIPPLEAWAYGCPVLTSDLRGIREQSGDAAVLVDPTSSDAIAAGIERLWTDASLREMLAKRGRARLAQYTPQDFERRLLSIVEEGIERKKPVTFNLPG